MKIINTLQYHRRQHYLSQKHIADLLGFQSTDRISRWEAGLAYPHLVNALKLAKLYDVSVEELYPLPECEHTENISGESKPLDSIPETDMIEMSSSTRVSIP
jgi:transcriptional regulator with XRE-family HTH domain